MLRRSPDFRPETQLQAAQPARGEPETAIQLHAVSGLGFIVGFRAQGLDDDDDDDDDGVHEVLRDVHDVDAGGDDDHGDDHAYRYVARTPNRRPVQDSARSWFPSLGLLISLPKGSSLEECNPRRCLRELLFCSSA